MPKYKQGDRIRYTSTTDRSTGDGWCLEPNEEFLVTQVGRKTYLLDCLKCTGMTTAQDIMAKHDQIDPHSTLLTSSPFPTMSVLQKARDLFLPENERLYREAGLKDQCGNWTDDARQVFLEQLMNADAEKVLLPIATKIVDQARDQK